MTDPVTIGFLGLLGGLYQQLRDRLVGHELAHTLDDLLIPDLPPSDENEEGSSDGDGGDDQPPIEILPTPQAEVPINGHGSTNGHGYRPQTFEDFIGNDAATRRVRIAVEAAQREHRMPPHMLLWGSAGVGKTTLATIVARALDAHVHTMTGGMLDDEAGLLRLLLGFAAQQQAGRRIVLVIDEVHGLAASRIPQEAWFPLLEDFTFFHAQQGSLLEFEAGGCALCPPETGPHHHEVLDSVLRLAPFTVIGMTTDPSDLATPLRDRFGLSVRLSEYTPEELAQVIRLHAQHRLGLALEAPITAAIAGRARGNPRIGISLLRECHDRAVVDGEALSEAVVERQASLMGLRADGMTEEDLRYLQALAANPKGLSLLSLASLLRSSAATLELMVEPWMKYRQYVLVTNRRHVQPAGKAYLASLGLLPDGATTSGNGNNNGKENKSSESNGA